jgi:hypothetical protein
MNIYVMPNHCSTALNSHAVKIQICPGVVIYAIERASQVLLLSMDRELEWTWAHTPTGWGGGLPRVQERACTLHLPEIITRLSARLDLPLHGVYR